MARSLASRDTRERVLDAAVRLVIESGWSSVTMSQVADTAAVSRQTVYNEVGTKSDLARALVEREMERFLAIVGAAFDENPDDLVEAIRQASHSVLDRARHNPLLVSVVAATHGADTELLPFLTTQADWMLEGAKHVVRERVAHYEHPLDPLQAETAIDLVVRSVLSHIMQPSGDPAATAAGIAWISGRLLGVDVRIPAPRAAEPDTEPDAEPDTEPDAEPDTGQHAGPDAG
jgi:AcrR family transcriptional regulator